MTLQSSGAISLSQVNSELGLAASANISLGASNVRTLAGVAGGAIALSHLYGKSSSKPITITFKVFTGVYSSFIFYKNGTPIINTYINETSYPSPIVLKTGDVVSFSVNGTTQAIIHQPLGGIIAFAGANVTLIDAYSSTGLYVSMTDTSPPAQGS